MQMQKPVNVSKIVENGGVSGKPLVISSRVFFGSMDTYLYAVDVNTGTKLWAYKANGPIFNSVVSDGKAIYFGCFDNRIYSISFDGKLLWTFESNGIIATTPAIDGDVIYFGSSDHHFYAVDLKSHRELWRFRANDEIFSNALVVENRIYFGSIDSYFYCLDIEGNLVWKLKTNSAVLAGTPTYDQNALYFGSADGQLYAVDFEGNLIWRFKTSEEVYNTAIVHDGMVYFTCRDRYIYCLDAKTGADIWKFRTEIDLLCPPVIHNNRIFFGAEKIYALNLDGYKVWESQELVLLGLNGVVWKNSIIFGAVDCKVRSFTFDGQINWAFRTNGVLAPIESWQEVQTAPKWNPHLFEPEIVKKAVSFNPYAISALTNEKIYGGLDTTGVDAYTGIPRGVGAYLDAGMESVKSYRPDMKKKKTREEERLEQQAKAQWGI